MGDTLKINLTKEKEMKLFFTSAAISVFTAFCLTIAGQTRASDYVDYKQHNIKERAGIFQTHRQQ
jgi:hypothetical protein